AARAQVAASGLCQRCAAQRQSGESGLCRAVTRSIALAIDREAQAAQRRQRQCARAQRVGNCKAAIADTWSHVAMVDLRWFAILAGLNRFALLLGGVLFIQRPAAAGAQIYRPCAESYLCWVDTACRLLAGHCIDADHFRHVGAREFRAQAAAWASRIPQAEYQRGRAEFEQCGRIAQVDVIDLAALNRFSKLHTVEEAVAKQRVGDAMRRFEAGYAQIAAQVLTGEVDHDHRQRNLLVLPGIEQRELNVVGFGLDRVQQHAGYGILVVGDAAFLGSVFATLICCREDWAALASGWLQDLPAAEGCSRTRNSIADEIERELVFHVQLPCLDVRFGGYVDFAVRWSQRLRWRSWAEARTSRENSF